MGLLIDGYNLLHVTDIFGGGGPRSFERSRIGLLNFVAVGGDARRARPAPSSSSMPVKHHPACPARDSACPALPLILPRTMKVPWTNCWEELIRQDHHPRQLTVVSSDHRVQRAANRRKATAIDSDVWYALRLSPIGMSAVDQMNRRGGNSCRTPSEATAFRIGRRVLGGGIPARSELNRADATVRQKMVPRRCRRKSRILPRIPSPPAMRTTCCDSPTLCPRYLFGTKRPANECISQPCTLEAWRQKWNSPPPSRRARVPRW